MEDDGPLLSIGELARRAVLASLLGVHIQTAVNWASHTRRDWTTYIAERVSTPARVHHRYNKRARP